MTKKQRKEQKQKKWGLAVNAQIPMVLVAGVNKHIQEILEEIIDGIASIGIQLVVVDSQNNEENGACKKWHGKYPESIMCISEDEIEEGVFDIAILSEVNEEELNKLKEHNMIPIAEGGKISPFDPVEEKGNGFVFEATPWSLFATLVRAAETYRFPYDWKNIIKALQKSV